MAKKPPKIEHNTRFQQLVKELDTLQYYSELSLSIDQNRIKGIKNALYQEFKNGVDNKQDTDLFQDPENLERLTNFTKTTLDTVEEKKRLLKKYSTYLHTKKHKAEIFFARHNNSVRHRFGKALIDYARAKRTGYLGAVTLTAGIGVITFLALFGLGFPILMSLGFLIPFAIVSIAFIRKICVDYYSHKKSCQIKMNVYHKKALAFEGFEKNFTNFLKNNPTITQHTDQPVAKPKKQLKIDSYSDAQKNAIKDITNFVKDGEFTVKDNGDYKFRINRKSGISLDGYEPLTKFKAALSQHLNINITTKQGKSFQHNNDTLVPYTFTFKKAQIKMICAFLTPDEQKDLLGDTFFIKSIRADDKEYYSTSFIDTITRSEIQMNKFPLRQGEKGKYHVNGLGAEKIKPKDKKNLPAKYQGKRPFSQSQSVSVTPSNDKITPLFQIITNAHSPLSGIALNQDDVFLSNRLCVHDHGTVQRPNHFASKAKAKAYASLHVKSETENKLIYSSDEFNEFLNVVKVKIKNPGKNSKYNEVLAGIRWNMDDRSSCLIIGEDTVEARLLTLHRAKLLHNRLRQQAAENNPNLPFDEDYQVPIVFYLPNNPSLHLKPYNIFQQKSDILEAKKIAAKSVAAYFSPPCNELYAQCRFEFLLALDTDDLERLINNNYSPMSELINQKRLSILIPVLSKLSPPTLEKILSAHGDEIINLMLLHPHPEYPEFIDILIRSLLNKSDKLNKIIFKLALIQNKLNNEKLEHFNENFITQNFKIFFYEILNMHTNNKLTDKTCKSLEKFVNLDVIDKNLPIPLDFNDHFLVMALVQNKNYFKKITDKLELEKIFAIAVRHNVTNVIDELKKNTDIDINNVLQYSLQYSKSNYYINDWIFWFFDNMKDKIDTSKLPRIQKLQLFDVACAARFPCFSAIEKLLDDNEFTFDLFSQRYNRDKDFFIFLLKHGKSKLFFKAVEKVISAKKYNFESIFNSIIEQKSFQIFKCYNHKIISFIECYNFIRNLKQYNKGDLPKIMLSSIKNLKNNDNVKPDPLTLILDNFIPDEYKRYKGALHWAMAKIRNPDAEIRCDDKKDCLFALEFLLERIDAPQLEKFYLRKRILKDDLSDNPYKFFINKGEEADNRLNVVTSDKPKIIKPVMAGWSR